MVKKWVFSLKGQIVSTLQFIFIHEMNEGWEIV